MSSFPAFTYATWSSSSEPWTTLGELTSAGGCTAAPPAMPGASCFVFWRAASVRVTTRRCLKSLPWIPTTLTADHRLVGYHRTPRLYRAKTLTQKPIRIHDANWSTLTCHSLLFGINVLFILFNQKYLRLYYKIVVINYWKTVDILKDFYVKSICVFLL